MPNEYRDRLVSALERTPHEDGCLGAVVPKDCTCDLDRLRAKVAGIMYVKMFALLTPVGSVLCILYSREEAERHAKYKNETNDGSWNTDAPYRVVPAHVWVEKEPR